MRANFLTFSRDMRGSRLYKVSPLLYPQEQLYNSYHLPKSRDLPEVGLETRFQVFDFGFADPGASIAPLNQAQVGIPLGRNFLASVLTGVVQAAASFNPPAAGQPGALASPAFLVNFLHTHDGKQRQFFSKDVTNVEALGNGADPLILKDPVLIPEGDTLTCIVRNLLNTRLQVQIVLTGGEF